MRELSTNINIFLFSILIYSIIMNLGISLYGIFRKPSIIKKIIALTIFSDSANVLAVMVGYRSWPTPSTPPEPPVLTKLRPSVEDINRFSRTAVDPLPQALVLTAVVIGLAVTVFLVFLTLQIYKHYGTVDVRKVRRLRG